jgi:hypothetical protein
MVSSEDGSSRRLRRFILINRVRIKKEKWLLFFSGTQKGWNKATQTTRILPPTPSSTTFRSGIKNQLRKNTQKQL